MKQEPKLTDVHENINRVENGLPLTKPLATLNALFQFEKKFREIDKIIHKKEILKEKRERNIRLKEQEEEAYELAKKKLELQGRETDNLPAS